MNLPQWFPELAFGFVFMVLFAVPFVPAWREWRTPTDRAPLAVPRESANGVHFFSNRFRVAAFLEIAAKRQQPRDGFEYARKPAADIAWTGSQVPLIAFANIRCGSDLLGVRPLYLKQNFHAGSGNRFSSLMAEGSIRLGNRTQITQWAHADGILRLGAYSVSLQRLSSASMVELDLHCCFERVTAPVIRFGLQPALPAPKTQAELVTADFIDLPRAIQKTASLFRIDGDCILRPGRLYRGSLIVTGKLWVGRNTNVLGDIKARDAIVIGPGAHASGSVVCERSIEIQNGAHVVGPVIGETDILLGHGARIGSSGQPTSVTATRIVASIGAAVHGSVWARETGVVCAA